MTVNIIISDESGGNSLADNIDLGKVDATGESTFQDLFIRHDANISPITDCSFYMTRYTGTGYLGTDVDADYAEVLSWGDADEGNGFIINQVPTSPWSSGEQFPILNDQIVKTIGGGTINNQFTLLSSAVVVGTPSGNGEIPLNGEAHIQVRVKVPDSVSAGAGYRAVELVMAYSATS